MFCIECGKEIEEGVLFCPECGAKVNAAAAGQSEEKTAAAGKTKEKKAKKPGKKLFGLILLLILAGAGVFVYLHFFTYRSVKVDDYDGDTELSRKGKEKELFEGLKLVPKDKVTTGDDGEVFLLIDSDKEVVAKENTCFTVNAVGNEKSGKVTIDLKYGTSLVTIDKKLKKDSEFELKTPNATCSVRGTAFKVLYDKNLHLSRIDVTKGVVRVKAGSNTLDLNAGESAVVVDDAITPIPQTTPDSALSVYAVGGAVPAPAGGSDGTEAPGVTEDMDMGSLAAATPTPKPKPTTKPSDPLVDPIVGTWNDDGDNTHFSFKEDGTGQFTARMAKGASTYKWQYDGRELTMIYDRDGRTATVEVNGNEFYYGTARYSKGGASAATPEPETDGGDGGLSGGVYSESDVIGSWQDSSTLNPGIFTFNADGTGAYVDGAYKNEFTWSFDGGKFKCSSVSDLRVSNGKLQIEDYGSWVDMVRK